MLIIPRLYTVIDNDDTRIHVCTRNEKLVRYCSSHPNSFAPGGAVLKRMLQMYIYSARELPCRIRDGSGFRDTSTTRGDALLEDVSPRTPSSAPSRIAAAAARRVVTIRALFKIRQHREKEVFKIQQEREKDLFKIQQHREKEVFKIQQYVSSEAKICICMWCSNGGMVDRPEEEDGASRESGGSRE